MWLYGLEDLLQKLSLISSLSSRQEELISEITWVEFRVGSWLSTPGLVWWKDKAKASPVKESHSHGFSTQPCKLLFNCMLSAMLAEAAVSQVNSCSICNLVRLDLGWRSSAVSWWESHRHTTVPTACEWTYCMYLTQHTQSNWHLCSQCHRQNFPQAWTLAGCRHRGNPNWWKNSHGHKALYLPAEHVMR